MKLITGRRGEAHITPMLDAMWHQALVGIDSCVFDAYENFATEVTSNNEITIHAGAGMFQGRFFVIPPYTTDSVNISNGTQSENRTDVIAIKFTNVEGVDNAEWVVIKGKSTAGTAMMPEVTAGDLEAGDTVATYPMFAVEISGISVTNVSALFERLSLVHNDHKHSATDITSGTLNNARLPVIPVSKGGTGRSNAPSMLVDLESKESASPLGSSPRPGVIGVLPVVHGGTGSKTAEGARKAIGAAPQSHSHGYTKVTQELCPISTESGDINWYVEKWDGIPVRAVGTIDLVLNYSQEEDGWYHPTEEAKIVIPPNFDNYVIKSTSFYVIEGSSSAMMSYPVNKTPDGFGVWSWVKKKITNTITLVVEIEKPITA